MADNGKADTSSTGQEFIQTKPEIDFFFFNFKFFFHACPNTNLHRQSDGCIPNLITAMNNHKKKYCFYSGCSKKDN